MNKQKTYINTPNILLLIVLILAVFAQTLPLIQVLNFEFSFVFSIILFLASGILTIHYLRKFKSFGVLPAIIRIKYKSYLLLLFFPLLISILSNLMFQICPFCDGILYYFIIVLPAFYIGFVLGAFAFWSNKQFAYIIFVLIFCLFAFIPLLEFYIYPQVYFYNIIVGIIPGTIYDEEILISGKLILFRLSQILLLTILLFTMFKVGTVIKKNRILLMLSTFLGAILFFLLKPFLGFSTSENNLYNNLTMSVLSTTFEIRYTDNLTQKNIQLLGLEHFYYMSEIENKTKLSTPKNLISFIFRDANQKGALFGSKAANVAKPWMNQIFLDYNSTENTLEHELTHIYAAQIGSTPFKIAGGFNMAMLEGYAMAIEDNYSGYDIHYMALLAKESGYNFNIPELFSKFNFFGQTSSLSYITAGSFIKFLIERYGIDKVNLVYQDLDFVKNFDKQIEVLESDYMEFLQALNYPINKHRANLFFGRNPITKKVCPRTVANDLSFSWKIYNEQNYYTAKVSFTKIYNYSNSYSALLGLVYSNSKLEFYAESLKLLANKISEFEGTSSYYSALLNLSDQYAYNQKFSEADSVYKLLQEYEPTLRYKNLAEIRTELIAKNLIFEYLQGSDFDKYVILKSINTDKLFDSSIPVLIELSERLDENIDGILSFLTGLNLENVSSNTAFEISKYLMKNNHYRESLKFAEIAVEKCVQKYELPIYKSHQKKVEWLSNTVFK
ncbi:MAG: hypothetical protein KKF62_03435 [Bacteroidetes bacterium]|nr:hypothetical protein [Bacteroidota bacterium]